VFTNHIYRGTPICENENKIRKTAGSARRYLSIANCRVRVPAILGDGFGYFALSQNFNSTVSVGNAKDILGNPGW